jgi:hypothetical protein
LVFFSNQTVKPLVQNWVDSQVISKKYETLLQFNALYIRLTISNLSQTDAITFRVVPDGVLYTIPPNAQANITDEIHSYLEINIAVGGFNPTWTINGDLVTSKELRRLGLFDSN